MASFNSASEWNRRWRSAIPGCPASLPDEAFFRKPLRHVNNRYDPDALFYSLLVGIPIHIPGIFIHIFLERPIHIPRHPLPGSLPIQRIKQLYEPAQPVVHVLDLTKEGPLYWVFQGNGSPHQDNCRALGMTTRAAELQEK